MEEIHDMSPATEPTGRFWSAGLPLIFCGLYLLVGLFFRRPDMGDPDSYREAISAIRYINEGIYASYWDHPLTMLFFVAATRVAHAFEWDQLVVLNVLAVMLTATTAWPMYHLARRLVSVPAAVVATMGYVLSPSLIRFTTYLSHEGVGFVFALWSVFLFERMLDTGGRKWALLFGISFGATCAARPNAAIFILPPLLALLLRDRARHEGATYQKLLLVALLGFFGCLLPIYRPAIISRILSRSENVFSAHYEFGWYLKSTSSIAVESLTPALVILSAMGTAVLLAMRRRFVVLFAGAWILLAYLFYTGILCRHRYFLILLPPCIMLAFAGSDRIDIALKFGRERSLHAAKVATLLLLLIASLGRAWWGPSFCSRLRSGRR
jgi:4-amino-4-deoxy-L-arabinose transferase-like glycosyltransferase